MKFELNAVVKSKIQAEAVLLNDVSQQIWQNPELNFKEVKAHDLLCSVLEQQGFQVQRQYILPTAFRAEYGGKNPGPTIAILCEYDALPEVGHACGHNLIAESGLGGGLGVKAALETDSTLPGKVVVLGCPAEEGGGGKIHLINGGAFKDIDIAMMVHPAPDDYLYTPFIAIRRCRVTYTGKEAHASGYPWEGINALDAAVNCYSSVSLLRQQIKPLCRIHGIITNGGAAPNIIPGLTELQFYCRAPTTKDISDLMKRLDACFNGAALATGCQVKIEYDNTTNYESLITNKVLVEIYQKHAQQMGVKFEDGNPRVIPFIASSDMGNVSHVVPSIHPCISIGTKAANHSHDFTAASGSREAQAPTLIAAEAMALLAIEVMSDPQILDAVKKQFQEDIYQDVA